MLAFEDRRTASACVERRPVQPIELTMWYCNAPCRRSKASTLTGGRPQGATAYSSMSSTEPTPTDARSCAVISLCEIVSA
jgi:hypothetical protein